MYPAGIQDGAIACAAAQVAVQALLQGLYAGLLARKVALLDGGMGRRDEPGRARAALQRIVAAVGLCMCTHTHFCRTPHASCTTRSTLIS